MALAYAGQALIVLCLIASLGGAAASAAGAARDRAVLRLAGARATWLLAASALAASAVLVAALVTRRYEIAYVATHVDNNLPVGFRITALWSGQEGSLLLWLTVLALFAAVSTARSIDTAWSYANAVMLGISAFFALLVCWPARPFAFAQTLASDGTGLSPALQNYWMAMHPPALYLGYIGIAVPFAIVMGALLAGRGDDDYIRSTRRWSLVAWIGLTAGLGLGARWAYEEIGWGGYWAWDPVENAALMPWLTMTAFLHSVIVQERRGMMRYWNVLLVTLSFALSIFGTFLTRSGILSSVHSFVESPIGWYFLGFLALSLCFAGAVLFVRRPLLASRNELGSVVSREATFLFNNLLLVAIAFMVLWGVLYPILSDAMGGQVSLQAPYYNFFLVAFGLPLLLLMGAGPLIAWGGSSARRAARRMAAPLLAGLVVALAMAVAGLASSWGALAACSLATFVLASVIAEFTGGVSTRRAAQPELSSAAALRQLFARNRRRYGGYVAHAGVALLVVGIAGSSAYTTKVERSVEQGDSFRAGGWTLTYEGAERSQQSGVMQVRGRFDVRRGERSYGTLEAGKNFYPAREETSNEVGIRSRLATGEDLFVIVDRLREDGSAQITVLVNPLVNLVWLALLVIGLGGMVCALPQRRRVASLAPATRGSETRSEERLPVA